MMRSLLEVLLFFLTDRAPVKEFAANHIRNWQSSRVRMADQVARASFVRDRAINQFGQKLLSRVLKAPPHYAGFDAMMPGNLGHRIVTPCLNLRALSPSSLKACSQCNTRHRAESSDAGSQCERRAALIGCLGAVVALVGPQPPAQAEVGGVTDVKERVIETIYSFEPLSGWTERAEDPSRAFREYDSGWSNRGYDGTTYGEITRKGVEELAAKMGLTDTPTKTFYDLGSGSGRAVLHMCATGYVRGQCCGIELSQARTDAAGALKAEVERVAGDGDLGSKLRSMVSFEQGDIREKDFSDATVIWTDNLCFPESVNKAIAKKMLAQPELEAVGAMLPLPGLEDAGFKRSTIRLDQTFARTNVQLYRRIKQ